MLNLNIESLLQIFYGIKNNIISNHMKQRRIDQNHNTRYSQGKLNAQNPSIIYFIFHKESWNNYIQLFSQESSCIQLIISHWSRQNWANSRLVFSVPCSCNSWWMQSLITNNFILPQLRWVSWESCGVLTTPR